MISAPWSECLGHLSGDFISLVSEVLRLLRKPASGTERRLWQRFFSSLLLSAECVGSPLPLTRGAGHDQSCPSTDTLIVKRRERNTSSGPSPPHWPHSLYSSPCTKKCGIKSPLVKSYFYLCIWSFTNPQMQKGSGSYGHQNVVTIVLSTKTPCYVPNRI